MYVKVLCSSLAFAVICLPQQTQQLAVSTAETAPAPNAAPSAYLTNDSIVKLAKAGMADEVILDMVTSQPGKYTITPDTLISLKEAGVSEKVIAAMVSHSGTASPNVQAAHTDAIVLHDGTPVRLRLSRSLSSADDTKGETVDFEVLDDVKLGDEVSSLAAPARLEP